MFDRKGQISYAPGVDEDALMEAALEAGADDVVAQEDGSVEVYTSFSDFLSVSEALTEAGFKGDEAEVAMIRRSRRRSPMSRPAEGSAPDRCAGRSG